MFTYSFHFHFHFFFLAILVAMLTACTTKSGQTPTSYYSPSGGVWNTCKDLHPVYARLQGCSNDLVPVTRNNANDKVSNICLLELAVNYRDLIVFRQLLNNGADIRLCAPGYPQRFYKVWVARGHCDYPKGSTEEFLFLLERLGVAVPDKQELLKTAASAGCAVAVRFLMARNVDLNFEYEDGLRPLHYVVDIASQEKIETARTLVNLGANPYLRSRNGESAIDRGRRILGSVSNWPRMEAALSAYAGSVQPGVPADRQQVDVR